MKPKEWPRHVSAREDTRAKRENEILALEEEIRRLEEEIRLEELLLSNQAEEKSPIKAIIEEAAENVETENEKLIKEEVGDSLEIIEPIVVNFQTELSPSGGGGVK